MTLLDSLKPKKIIVRMPNWIGDLVMATPVLTDLRKGFPNAHITALCRTPLSELLREDPDLNEVLSFTKTSAFSRRSEKRDIIEKLRRGKYDLGILLTHWFSSAWWFWQGRVNRRLGSGCNGSGFLLTDRVPLPKNIQTQHLVLTYKMLLQPLGIPLSETLPRLHFTHKEIDEASTLLKQLGVSSDQLLVGINPGATYGSAKCWIPERFREVTKRLLKDPSISVVYFGDPLTLPLVKKICADLPPRVINLSGQTSIRQLGCLIKLCDVLLTNDSGPMHMGVALGTPILALFGSTNEIVTGPYQTGKVIHKHVECSPCYKRVCPIDFRCMKQIGEDEVFNEIIHLLQSKKSPFHTHV